MLLHRKQVFMGLSLLCFFNMLGFYFLLKTHGVHRFNKVYAHSYNEKRSISSLLRKKEPMKSSRLQVIFRPVELRKPNQILQAVSEDRPQRNSVSVQGNIDLKSKRTVPTGNAAPTGKSFPIARPKRSRVNNNNIMDSSDANENINIRKLAEIESVADVWPSFIETMVAEISNSNPIMEMQITMNNKQLNSTENNHKENPDSVLHSSNLTPFAIYTLIKNKLAEEIVQEKDPNELLMTNIIKKLLNDSHFSPLNTVDSATLGNNNTSTKTGDLHKESIDSHAPEMTKANEITREKDSSETQTEKLVFRDVRMSSNKNFSAPKFIDSSTWKPYIDLKNLSSNLKEIILNDKTNISDKSISSATILESLGNITDSKGNLCQTNSSLDLIIFVTSAPQNSSARMAIRKTWGHYATAANVRLLFYLGNTNSTVHRKEVNIENLVYGDIIQDRFLDSYKNLSLKSVRILQWVVNYCYNAKFVLKADDDTFVNIPLLIKFLQHNIHKRKAIFGVLLSNREVIRDPNSKWYISPEEIQKDVYPNFIAGPSYVISNDALLPLLKVALSHPLFPLEDVFITGFCAQKAKVKRLNNLLFHNDHGKLHYCDYRNYISFHYVKPHEMFEVWKELNINQDRCLGMPDLINMAQPLQTLHRES